MTFFQLSLFCAFVALSLSGNGENTTLLLVQTFSRHGERGPHFLYPNDPNSPDDFPNGLGMLTQTGKKTHRDVGKFFRSLYNNSITSNPNQVFVNSSAQDRCLMSAQAQLSSFFAPYDNWMFSPDIEWQPIAVHYLPIEMDRYLNYQRFCPRAEQTLEFHHLQDYLAENPTMVENISNYSGLNYSDPNNAFELYGILETEKSHNLIIPEWADVYWDQMHTVEEMALKAFYSSPIQLRLRVGSLLGLINKNMNDKINGKNPDVKFLVNLTHDEQIIGVLAALNYTNLARPRYCWTLLFELHEMPDTSKTVRVLYMNTTYPLETPEPLQLVVIDGCSEFCPVEYFMKSYQWLIPDNITEECKLTNSSNKSDSAQALYEYDS